MSGIRKSSKSLTNLTIRRAAHLLEKGLINSEQLAGYCYSLAVAGEEIWGLNAYSQIVDKERFLEHARASDDRRRQGNSKSIFDGIPISIKSNIAVKEFPLTAGSRILGFGRDGAHPCGYDADTVQILQNDCGALLVGLTSMDEFGMGSLGNNIPRDIGGTKSSFGLTRNPLPYIQNLNLLDVEELDNDLDDDKLAENLAEMICLPHEQIMDRHTHALWDQQGAEPEKIYSAGGSSCGSAASIAHGSALLSLGTDTGGSVRLPASWCSIVGLKPSYGLLSRHGIVSYASSFDTVGILGKSVDCVNLALDKLVQRDGDQIESRRDSTFSSYPTQKAESTSAKDLDTMKENSSSVLNGIRIGIPSSFSVKECPPEIRQAWSNAAESLANHGAEVLEISENEISPTVVQNALSAYYVLVSAEASSNFSRYDGFRYAVPPKLDDDSQVTDPNLTPLERQYATTRSNGFGKEVSRRILCGTSVLSSDRFHTYYEAAAKLRALLGRQLNEVLDNKVDLLLVPTALTLPCRLDKDHDDEPLDSTAMFANDVMTVGPSLAGLPAVSVPVKVDGESTFMSGLQLIGPRLREDLILYAGGILEERSSTK